MSEIKLTPKQKENIARLLNTAAKDTDLQAKLVVDPLAVLKKYGLANLVKGRDVHVGLDIKASPEAVKLGGGVSAFWGWHVDANTPHVDASLHQDVSRPHADSQEHADTPSTHVDSSHQDVPSLHFDA